MSPTLLNPYALGSSFSPTSISGLQAWYDASDATSFTFSSGSVVSQWNDKSTNNRHLIQNTVSKQPSRSGLKNGLSTVVFDGSQNTMSTTMSIAQPFTISLIIKYDNNDTNDRYVLSGSSGGIHTSTTWRMFWGSDLNSGVSDDSSWHLFTCIANGSSSLIELDGSSIASGSSGSGGSINNIYIGSWPIPSNYWDGEIAEIMIWNSSISVENKNSILLYSQNKWGTP